MAINFPNNPTVSQIYSFGGYSWQWNGSYWESYSTTVEYLPLSGGTVTGGTIFQSGLTANTISATTYFNLPVSGLTEGNGISITNNGIGNFTITSTATTSNVVQGITGITGTSGVSATTTNYGTTIINTAPDQIVTISGGTGIITGGTYPNFTITNTDPDQTVTITGGTNIEVNGTYPNFGVNFTGTTEVSGEYLPLSGGTVTGDTFFTSGVSTNTLTANTVNFDMLSVSNFTEVDDLDVFGNSNFFIDANFLQDIIVNGTSYSDTVSATTYLNYPDSYVTGFTPNGNVLTISQNRNDIYSALTLTLTGLTASTTVVQGITGITGTSGVSATTTDFGTTIINTAPDQTVTMTGGTGIQIVSGYPNFGINFTGSTGSGGTISGEYLPLSGGTVSGGTVFTNGLSANTISAATYDNLPLYNAGLLTNSDQWINNNDGTVTLPSAYAALYNQTIYPSVVEVFLISSGTSGTQFPALSNNDTNYVVIDYSGGTPSWNILTNNSTINGETIVLTHIIYRANNFLHVLDFGNEGIALPNKINDRIVAVDRFGRESGFSLGLSASTGVVTLTSGIAWNGTNRQSLVAVNSQDDIFFQVYHTGGTWTYTTTANTLNNLYYDDGTNPVLATGGKYLVNWYFRGQEINDHLYEVWGVDEYDSVSEAQLSTEPNLPELITSHAFLTGRIIVQVSATTGTVESAFVQVFQPSTVQAHNDLTSIQGGQAGEYYHLTSTEYNNVAYKNTTNTFTSDQIINGNLTATTISATTYDNLPSFNYVQIDTITQFSAGTNNYINFSGINITITSAATNTLVFSAGTGGGGGGGGVTSISAGSGLSGNTTTGAVTIVNTQVQGITGITAGYGISANTSNNVTTIIQQFDYGKAYTTGNNLNFL
jgi:hypothetical protein